MFSNTDVENVIPPVNAKTMEAKMPRIVIYSLCIFAWLSLDSC